MRLNFTGRRKIDKQHACVLLHDDPPGSRHGYYFELVLDLSTYQLPSDARVFVEVSRKLTLMRFDVGTVGSLAPLSPSQRRLGDFSPNPQDGLNFRLKVVQPDGPDTGKLLAEADGLIPNDGGKAALLRVAAADLGDTPFSLELIPTDSALPTLWINTRLGGKAYANDPHAKPLLMTAVTREVFAILARLGEIDEDPDHWAYLWRKFAVECLGCPDTPEHTDEQAVRDWVENAVNEFAKAQELTPYLTATIAADLNLQQLDHME